MNAEVVVIVVMLLLIGGALLHSLLSRCEIDVKLTHYPDPKIFEVRRQTSGQETEG